MKTGRVASGGGLFVPVVGPSGVGKDSLLRYCRERLAHDTRFSFPRRLITRPAGDVNEDHIAISKTEFAAVAARGAFALQWSAHGLRYGVPGAIDGSLQAGKIVIVNLSRTVLDEVRRRYHAVMIVSVSVPAAVLAERLRGRGRETADAVESRIARAAAIPVSGDDVVTIDNSGPLESAGEAFLARLRASADC